MRALLFSVLIFGVITTNAQLVMSVTGGWCSTMVHNKNSENSYGSYLSKSGWQAGLHAEYGLKNKHWLLYSGLVSDNKVIRYQSQYYSNYGTTYKPALLTLPLGATYVLASKKNIGLRFYAGLFGSIGLGGKYIENEVEFTPAWPIYIKTERGIRFGNNISHDLKTVDWGTQFGIGIRAGTKAELVCMYNFGLSNILPSQQPAGKLYLSSISLGLKYDIVAFASPAKK